MEGNEISLCPALGAGHDRTQTKTDCSQFCGWFGCNTRQFVSWTEAGAHTFCALFSWGCASVVRPFLLPIKE